MEKFTIALLNDEGKKEFKEIFSDGKVPVLEITQQDATSEKLTGSHPMYRVDISELKQKQYAQLIKKIARAQNAEEQEVKVYFNKLGFIPLQGKWIQGAATNRMELFS